MSATRIIRSPEIEEEESSITLEPEKEPMRSQESEEDSRLGGVHEEARIGRGAHSPQPDEDPEREAHNRRRSHEKPTVGGAVRIRGGGEESRETWTRC
ncbi:hypothetical protein GCK72_002656 [Caenorhabditis remanei]|uniref:Uncharacterized protein n=1 Tax=Caenorhabditis remanei TaxID=31234 RepID=A0A6A5HXR8_CAERE|nr:hypothetical protein GCK72_002656 [Caenorhabditis remanei]KAF1770832.1 hypothetical protein GCK72_002656 [Caenorhabditis remanei]